MYLHKTLALGLATTLLLTAGCTPQAMAAPVNKPMHRADYDKKLVLDSQSENTSSFHCSNKDFPNGAMIIRTHSGDENGSSEVTCANFTQGGSQLKYENAAATEKTFKQSAYPSGGFVCDENKFIVGREHSGDENGNTTYYCRGLVGYWNEEIKTGDAYWSEWQKESNFDLECDYPEALIGFDHKGDENGDSRIKCAKLL
jgi:hypothetical protein